MQKQVTITKKHLDRALSVPWSTTTCLVAQALSEAVGEPMNACSAAGGMTYREYITIVDYKFDGPSHRAMNQFDGYGRGEKPEDIRTRVLPLLPITITIRTEPRD